jgi:hypothetical protein
MPETRRIEESAEEFGKLMIDLINRTAEQMGQGLDLERLARSGETAELDVAIPFRLKVRVEEAEGQDRTINPKVTVCCACTRFGGTVQCFGSSTEPCC